MTVIPYFIEQLVEKDFRVLREKGWVIYRGIKIMLDSKQNRYLICGNYDDFGNIEHTFRFKEQDFEKIHVVLLERISNH